jgi:hypothetical protein
MCRDHEVAGAVGAGNVDGHADSANLRSTRS